MNNLKVLESDQINDATYKNRFIEENHTEYLAFVDAAKFTEDQLRSLIQREDMLSCGDVFALCAGETQDAVMLPFENVPECFALQIVALVFRRDLLASAGSYNYKLHGMTDFELLCRLAEASGNAIFVFPGIEEDVLVLGRDEAYTCAYIVRRYLKKLQAAGRTEQLLQQTCYAMEQCGVLADFKTALNQFLGSVESYENVAIVTAPFVVLRGDETCYGVLQDFADNLAGSLRKRGQACILAENGKTDYEYLMNHVSKAIIGFQSKAFKMDFFKNLHGPKMQFWFDNPVFYEFHFADLAEDCHILCHDINYVDFIREHYHKKNARLFPPAGHALPWTGADNRPLDIVFIGKYEPESSEPFVGRDREFYEYMLKYPNLTFAEGMRGMLSEKGKCDSDLNLSQCFVEMKQVCQNVINHYRRAVMETILEAGYEVHVYGDSWDMYQSPNAHRLIRHPEVSVEESIREWQKAKIGLNVMSWHKAGMTERIANIMLSGAVCLSEETTYLREHFTEGEQLVTFQLENLKELPHKIEQLLKDDRWCEIARKGYEIASCEHTWDRRASQLVDMIEEII